MALRLHRNAMDMSGATAARALRDRFEAIRRTEWTRLERRVAALGPAERQEIEALVAEVVHALAEPPVRQLADADEPELVRAALHLFGVTRGHARLTAR
jgi:glutamyl-tRNA reductase